MKLAVSLTFLAACLTCAGCPRKQIDLTEQNFVESDGLAVGIELPKREFLTGEVFETTVYAVNKTREPIAIEATTGAQVYLRIWRKTVVGWDEVKRYPQAAVLVMTPWQVAPRETRRFTMRLTVEPDWPTHEPLRITAELNGRPAISPGMIIRVTPSAKIEK